MSGLAILAFMAIIMAAVMLLDMMRTTEWWHDVQHRFSWQPSQCDWFDDELWSYCVVCGKKGTLLSKIEDAKP